MVKESQEAPLKIMSEYLVKAPTKEDMVELKTDFRREFDNLKGDIRFIYIPILICLFAGIYGLYFRINHKLNELLPNDSLPEPDHDESPIGLGRG